MFTSCSCPAILLWWASLLLYYSYSFSVPITANETEHLALLAIKSQLLDPLGYTSSWNNSTSLCQWRGITCSHRHQRVTEVDLSNQRIGGTLSPYIGNLSFLRSIDLANNSFFGEIPPEVGRLFRLRTLWLLNNSFSGTIPVNLSHCSNLVVLHASRNNLTGEIPTEIGYLLKLEELALRQNHLTGQLTASIGNLSALQVIDVQLNTLGGRIPDNLGQLRRLTLLGLGANHFSGTVPLSLYNISSLTEFVLTYNRFTGILPPNIGLTLPNLIMFAIDGNNFTGNIPDSFSNASDLSILDLGRNNLTGSTLLSGFSRLKNLSFLSFEINNLGTGTANDLDFVTSLTNCSKLKDIVLNNNQFGGVLPHSIANLSKTMKYLEIGSNQIAGTIPSGIGNLVNLNALDIGNNYLTGFIPPVIGELKNLQYLGLYANYFQGRIPLSLGNLTLLSTLDLYYNNLEGNIPSSLGNCQNLMILDLSKNNLTGSMPPQILGITTLSIYLGLSHNHLSGPLPLEVGSLQNLVELEVSRNQFFGEIPVTLGGCTSLEYLGMQGNFFNGSIPLSLSSLKSIKKLDLSQNNLTGQIPVYFQNLFLEYLNLSYNHFEGEVPTEGVFSNATKFSLKGNEKLCGGIHELQLSICHSKGSKKQKATLPKLLIPIIASCLILSLCLIIVLIRRRKTAHKSFRMLHLQEHFPMISYADLSKATNEFSSSNMIGKGSYGHVYKGILGENGMLVAVKVLNLEQKGASKSFMAECKALSNIRHRNLTKIITVCSSIDFKGKDFKALVFEYMQNGGLDEWLYHSNDQHQLPHASNLSFIQRLNIAIDIASAIEYLHHNCQAPIVHGDLKPSNVLLDQELVAHVSDFGLARFLDNHPLNITPENQSSSIGIKGTIGYIAPEYGMGGELSVLGDIYSFGILLLEMFTRRRPTDSMFKDGLTLHDFGKMALSENVIEIIEPSLLLEVREENLASCGDGRVRIEECFVSIVKIGVLCSMESPTERMMMTDVVAKLCAIRRNFLNNRI